MAEEGSSNTAIVAIIIIAIAAIFFLFFYRPWGEKPGETPAVIQKEVNIENPATPAAPATRNNR